MRNKISEQILLVDDDRALLDGFRRTLRKAYNLKTACGGKEGLEVLAEHGPFAVVVSDYQMPGMSGTEFLGKVREAAPDTVRIMLTGNADLQSAIEAVNTGHVFRFLTKPCSKEVFIGCLDAAFEQYRLRNAEQELLEHTLRGSIEVLTDVLSLANPTAFGRATRIRNYVHHIAGALNLENSWQYETAALLSQIGCVAIPDDLLDRVAAGETLPPDQVAMMERHPEIARDLLKKIPRLEAVAEMIFSQRSTGASVGSALDDQAPVGDRVLAAAHDFDELISLGATPTQALDALEQEVAQYGREVIEALSRLGIQEENSESRLVPLTDMQPGMVLAEDVRQVDGELVVPSGYKLTGGSLARLRNYCELELLTKSEYQVCLEAPADQGANAA